MKNLALKYRPIKFDDVVEQDNIKKILQYQIKTDTNKNCYLFTGGAGTGKTTCARIFANELNNFAKGGVVEIDGASNNGVDNVRSIIEDAKFKPMSSRYKVYIVDEVHMFSTGAWNAMLKIIEEPPSYLIFIFCTTDPQKIPRTILSRVQRYDFKKITTKAIYERLSYICKKEKFKADVVGGIEYVAKLANGGLRDAIMMLDQCTSFSEDLTLENISNALGIVNFTLMMELTDSLISNDSVTVLKCIDKIFMGGIDIKQFVKQYTLFILDICKFYIINETDILQLPDFVIDWITAFKTENYKLCYGLLKVLVDLGNDIKWDTNPKQLVDVTFLLFCDVWGETE